MISNKSIISSINKYGLSCQLLLSSEKIINFKGIIFYKNFSSGLTNHDFLHSDPCETSSATLIVADPSICNQLAPDLIIKTQKLSFQILNYKKFLISDQLYYISASLLTI